MKISVDEDSNILLEEVFSGIGLKTADGETMGICMRDSGFEFNYNGQKFSAQNGFIRKLSDNTLINFNETGRDPKTA